MTMNEHELQLAIREAVKSFLKEAKSTPGNPNVFWLVTSISTKYDKNLKDLSSGILEGISGISDNNKILMHWLGIGYRNAVVVMNASSVLSVNGKNLRRIEYNNIEQLTSNNMSMLRRIFNADEDVFGNRRIIDNIYRALYRGALTANDEGVRHLGALMRDGYISSYDTNKRYEDGKVEINSFEELSKYFWEEISKNTTAEDVLSIDQKIFRNLLKNSVLKSVHTYKTEGEWIVTSPYFKIPAKSKLLVAVETPLENFPKEAQAILKNGGMPKIGKEIPTNLLTHGMRPSMPIIKAVFDHKLDNRYDIRFIDINKFKEIQIKLQTKHVYG